MTLDTLFPETLAVVGETAVAVVENERFHQWCTTSTAGTIAFASHCARAVAWEVGVCVTRRAVAGVVQLRQGHFAYSNMCRWRLQHNGPVTRTQPRTVAHWGALYTSPPTTSCSVQSVEDLKCKIGDARRVMVVGNGGIALELVHALTSAKLCQVSSWMIMWQSDACHLTSPVRQYSEYFTAAGEGTKLELQILCVDLPCFCWCNLSTRELTCRICSGLRCVVICIDMLAYCSCCKLDSPVNQNKRST